MVGNSFGIISHRAMDLVTFTVVLTLIVSAYVVVYRCPTPIGMGKSLHRD